MGTDLHPSLPDGIGSNLHRIQREREAEQVAANIAAVLSSPEVRAAQLDVLFWSPVQAVAFIGPDGTFWAANHAFASLLGYSPKELLHRTWQSITHPDDRTAGEDEVAATVRGEQPAFTTVRRYLPKYGPQVLCSVRVTRVADRAGDCVHLIEQATQVPDRRDPARGDRRGGTTFDLMHRHWLAVGLGVLLAMAVMWLIADNAAARSEVRSLRERNSVLTDLIKKGESP